MLCKTHVNDVYQMICHCLQAEMSTMHWLAWQAKMWPCLLTTTFFQHLVGDKVVLLHNDWKASLIKYRVAISNMQQAERLLACIGNNSELLSKLSNLGY